MSYDPINFITVLKQFSDRLRFMDNSTLTSLAVKLGAKGYVSLLGNIVPKTELRLLD